MSSRERKHFQKCANEPDRIILDFDGLRRNIKKSSLGRRLKELCLTRVNEYEAAKANLAHPDDDVIATTSTSADQIAKLQQVCTWIDDQQMWMMFELIRVKN
jgi:hypothetical protein